MFSHWWLSPALQRGSSSGDLGEVHAGTTTYMQQRAGAPRSARAMVRSCAFACFSASFCAAVSALASALPGTRVSLLQHFVTHTRLLCYNGNAVGATGLALMTSHLCRFRSSLSASLAAFAAALASAFSCAFIARCSSFAPLSAATCCESFFLLLTPAPHSVSIEVWCHALHNMASRAHSRADDALRNPNKGKNVR